MTQHYLTPHRPKRPASRLVAGLLWLAAAGLAVGATFTNIVIYEFGGGTSLFVVGFWRQYGLDSAGQVSTPGTIYYGASEVAGAAFLLLATLLVFLSARRWAAVVGGALGTGMLVTATLTWFLTALSEQVNTKTSIEPGLWYLAGATGVALLAFLVSLLERERPGAQPSPVVATQAPSTPQSLPLPTPPAPSSPAPPPTWEPETPKFGVAVPEPPTKPKTKPKAESRTKPKFEPKTEPQFEPKTKPKAKPSIEPSTEPDSKPVAVAAEEDVFFDAFDSPEFTATLSPPRPSQTPETRAISRKLDGGEP
ncbi:outer membrane biosynthesis protein TonB [Kibdelosporangium banguiense]|uniref:Outer membrane biosynthesis protein TonB n=1 Tax=Kibdelosporangium banguiense TaxID=1365924 RepID=A0ABS4TI83_9PSEU|nr:hypothetical protein [Kibdelosporangium banguiense]MBP2324145.1 outer membrane biosynthesis protein TonB [Kibdelosporangium banguiense]